MDTSKDSQTGNAEEKECYLTPEQCEQLGLLQLDRVHAEEGPQIEYTPSNNSLFTIPEWGLTDKDCKMWDAELQNKLESKSVPSDSWLDDILRGDTQPSFGSKPGMDDINLESITHTHHSNRKMSASVHAINPSGLMTHPRTLVSTLRRTMILNNATKTRIMEKILYLSMITG